MTGLVWERQEKKVAKEANKSTNCDKLVLVLSCYELGVCLTSVLLWEGRCGESVVNCLCIERHAMCAAHVVNPYLFVCCWQVVDAGVWSQAGVYLTCSPFLEEGCAEPFAMPIRHGHESIRGVYDISRSWGMVSLLGATTIVTWKQGLVRRRGFIVHLRGYIVGAASSSVLSGVGISIGD